MANDYYSFCLALKKIPMNIMKNRRDHKTGQYFYEPVKLNLHLVIGMFGKVLCKLGWHNFSCSLQDCIDEFGYLPNDGRMPKKAKCKRCGVNYR